jgi:hypothetical protein
MFRLPCKNLLIACCNVMAIYAAAGCHNMQAEASSAVSPASTTETAMTQQLMIKFKPNTIACDDAGIMQLSTFTRVQLEFVRPMSGGACVIRQVTQGALDLLPGQQRLKQHPAVEWLEPDARKKAL